VEWRSERRGSEYEHRGSAVEYRDSEYEHWGSASGVECAGSWAVLENSTVSNELQTIISELKAVGGESIDKV